MAEENKNINIEPLKAFPHPNCWDFIDSNLKLASKKEDFEHENRWSELNTTRYFQLTVNKDEEDLLKGAQWMSERLNWLYKNDYIKLLHHPLSILELHDDKRIIFCFTETSKEEYTKDYLNEVLSKEEFHLIF